MFHNSLVMANNSHDTMVVLADKRNSYHRDNLSQSSVDDLSQLSVDDLSQSSVLITCLSPLLITRLSRSSVFSDAEQKNVRVSRVW